ncbi:MAG TPA: MMPL family transporter [Acidimicrobiales bacterium]|nr:MMPL family transporter [Acidimicrobiales bacterium]
MFARLGRYCHDRRKLVLLVWIAVLIGGNVFAGVTGNGFKQQFSLPDVESKRGFDILDKDFGGQGAGQTGRIVFQAGQGVNDPAVRSAMEGLLAKVAKLDDVKRVASPYAEGETHQISRDGKIAYADVEMPQDIDQKRALVISDAIKADEPRIQGLQIELGGEIFGQFAPPSSEALGVAFAVVILIVAFGSVLAMGLPVGVALFGIGIGTTLITILSHVFTIPDFSTFLGVMIGLGVGIDYALLIVTRFREQLHGGHTVGESVTIALDTAGRSVLFAGTTVIISLMGMLLMGVSFVTGLAIGAASVVFVTVLSSLTLLPALLGFAGKRVELTRFRGLVAAGLAAVALACAGLGIGPGAILFGLLALLVLLAGLFVKPLQREVQRHQKPIRETTAYKWSRVIQHRPWPAAIGGALILMVIALPFLGVRLGFSDESNYAKDTTTRKAYDLLVKGFGPGFNGTMIMATELRPGTDAGALDAITDAVKADKGVAFASPVQMNPKGTAALWNLVPTSGPQDKATTDLVHRLRDNVLPPAEKAAGVDVAVTGTVAVQTDFSAYLASRMPYFFAAVLGLSFILLMVVFRSLLVPLKAVIMNLLSISAAYGIVVMLFQWGWGSDITHVQPAPIEPWAPMMLFAIVFGLSMDYEVFLLSRVREEWKRTGDSHASVADGLAATAKVITAAALIMVFVFGSFILENNRVVKLMGVGLAAAIFLDATVVRMLLVPATMELLGDKNWWLPKWLDRALPNLDVEGHAEPVVEPALEPV